MHNRRSRCTFRFFAIAFAVVAIGCVGAGVYSERQQLRIALYQYLYPGPEVPLVLQTTIAYWQETQQSKTFTASVALKPERIVPVGNALQLRSAIADALPGDMIVIEPGVYGLTGKRLRVDRPGEAHRPIQVVARSPWRTRIELDMVEGFYINAPYWQFRGLEIVGVCLSDRRCEHAFHLVGHGSHTVLQGNRISGFNAHVKANGTGGKWPDFVSVKANSFTNSGPRDTSGPVTFIDVVGGSGWRVSNNLIANFKKGGGDRTSYAAFFKGAGAGNRFMHNLVLCSGETDSRFVQVGLSFGGGGTNRQVCRDKACNVEHWEGLLAGNLVANCSDVGIYLNRADQTEVRQNTLFNTRGIDIRFPGSRATLTNNLLSGDIRQRDGGQIVSRRGNRILAVRSGTGPSFEQFFVAPERFNYMPSSMFKEQGETKPALSPDLCGNINDSGDLYVGALNYNRRADCLYH